MPRPQDDRTPAESDDDSGSRSDSSFGMGRVGKYVRYSQLAWTFIGAFGVPTAIGIWIDGSADSSPWGTIVGLFIGLALATTLVMRDTTGQKKKPR